MYFIDSDRLHPEIEILRPHSFRYYCPNLAIMRILTIVLVLAFAPIYGQAQNTVTGKIVDELGLPIYMAGISLDSSETVVYTDYDGNFTLSSTKDFHWKINISSAGYKSESFFVLDGGSAGEITLQYGDELRELLISEQSLPDDLKKP